MEYGNQTDHCNIDRQLILSLLQTLTKATTEISGSRYSRIDHMDKLLRLCDSELEKRWLQRVHESQHRLPTHAQYLISSCSTRPDFYYSDANMTVFIDGPVHDNPAEKIKDKQITERLIEAGYLVIRFHHAANWNRIFNDYQDIYGKRKENI